MFIPKLNPADCQEVISNQWYSVHDCLPAIDPKEQESIDVVIFDNGDIYIGNMRQFDPDKSAIWYLSDGYRASNVTHWHWLPRAPKGYHERIR